MVEKFTTVPVGSRFELEGESWIKVSPLLARQEGGGAQRMIPRSALVRRLDGVAHEAPPAGGAPRDIALAHAREVLERLRQRCDFSLGVCAGACDPGRMRDELAEAFAEALRELEAQ